MARTLDPQLRRALAERVRFCHEMGIYDFYQRDFDQRDLDQGGPRLSKSAEAESASGIVVSASSLSQLEQREEMSARKSAVVTSVAEKNVFEIVSSRPESGVADPVAALKLIREDLGDCTRCKLHQEGRKQIVFGVGNPQAELMFVGEGPGADEDAQGEPFVGRAGQLLNNMIKAMGIERKDVYIANIVKCRPPGNRTPEREECATCSPFLMRQIAVVEPKVIVALGAVAAKTLLAMSASMMQLRGRFYDFRPAGFRNDDRSNDPDWDGCKLAVTYHPAFLLRDPRQKGEAWKDLQMVMKELGMKAPKTNT